MILTADGYRRSHEETLMLSTARPIVLLRKTKGAEDRMSAGVCGLSQYVGAMAIGLLIIIANISLLPSVFVDIFKSAFDFQSITGGFAGSCVVWGVKRGLFSNEAGMGSAPNAAASADVSHPVKQGMVQVISVFIDTILICSTTVFIILCTNKYTVGGELNGIPLVQESVRTMFGNAGIMSILY